MSMGVNEYMSNDGRARELDALRERITADGRHWRALIGFATLIRNRLAAPRLSRREYADDFAFLRIELAAGIGIGHAAVIEYGVRSGRERHTVGVVTGRWEDAELQDVRAWTEGQTCELAEAWQWIERGALDEMPELRKAQQGRVLVLN